MGGRTFARGQIEGDLATLNSRRRGVLAAGVRATVVFTGGDTYGAHGTRQARAPGRARGSAASPRRP